MNTTPKHSAEFSYMATLNEAFYVNKLTFQQSKVLAQKSYDYELAVSTLVEQGLTRSDAQGVVDAQQSI